MAKSIYYLTGAPFLCTGYAQRGKASPRHKGPSSFISFSLIIALLLGSGTVIAVPCPAAHYVFCRSDGTDLPPPPEGNGTIESVGQSCRVERKQFFSKACSSPMAYYAFVPSPCGKAARYPVLYLLHGILDSYAGWKEHAGNTICRLASNCGIVIVTPEGRSFGWYTDSRLVENNQVETYFIKELIPHVEKNFPTSRLRGIAGLSMGGHGAFVLSLRNPGVFSSVSSMSGILDITRHTRNWHLPELFGPCEGKFAADWDEHSALRLIEHSQVYIRSLPMLITVSTDDPFALDDNRLVHEQLQKMDVDHIYIESPGRHDWTYWKAQLPVHVSFHARHLCKTTKN